MSDHERYKILVSAYACDPNLGSEPGMGGNWVVQLGMHHDLWVLTEAERYASSLASYVAQEPSLCGHVHVIGISRLRRWEWLGPISYYRTYRLWQEEAYHVAQQLMSEVRFDLVHQLNMIGYREPGFLRKLPVPFVWGPIGGHAQMPWRFLLSLGWRGALVCGVRNVLNSIQMRASARVRDAMRRASVLVAATKADRDAIQRIHGRDTILINEQGAKVDGVVKPDRSKNGRLRLIWCGGFFPRKALPLGLKALRVVADRGVDVELHIVGSGACESNWKALARRLGVSGMCTWHGKLSHDDAMEWMENSDAMLFTSLQEGTPAVVLEAIQAGLPVVCHDACGFGDVVDDKSGIKIAVKSPQVSIEGFAAAIERLAAEPALRARLSKGAAARAKELAWSSKAAEMLEVYKSALGVSGSELVKGA